MTGFNTNYNALRLSAKHRFSQNYSLLAVYTYSHCLQDTETLGNKIAVTESNPFNRNVDYGPCDYDLRHNFVASVIYSGYKFQNRAVNLFAGQWQTSFVFIAYNGFPINPLTGSDSSLSGVNLDRPNAVAPNSGLTSCGTAPVLSKYSPTGAFNLPCYIDAPANGGPASSFYAGNLGRNFGVKPYTVFTDLRIARAFTFPHEIQLQLTADVFNLINKNNTLDVNLLYTAAGTPTSSYDPRQFQF